jgi:hypothetical protein
MGTLSGTKATFTTSSLAVGAASITALYSGDTNFKSSQSAALTETITTITSPADFTVTATPSSLTLKQGQIGSVLLTITPLNGFNLPITPSCGTLPSGVTCAFTPTSVTPSGAPLTIGLLITTTAPTFSMLHKQGDQPFLNAGNRGAMGLALALCLMPFTLRRGRKVVRLLVVLAAISLVSLSGCGGGSPKPTNSGTPTGTTTVTVNLSAGTGASPTQHPAAFTLVVTN